MLAADILPAQVAIKLNQGKAIHVHAAAFVAFKHRMASQPGREALKRRRDVLQADAVQQLLDKYLSQI
jgi:hypothetical protein